MSSSIRPLKWGDMGSFLRGDSASGVASRVRRPASADVTRIGWSSPRVIVVEQAERPGRSTAALRLDTPSLR